MELPKFESKSTYFTPFIFFIYKIKWICFFWFHAHARALSSHDIQKQIMKRGVLAERTWQSVMCFAIGLKSLIDQWHFFFSCIFAYCILQLGFFVKVEKIIFSRLLLLAKNNKYRKIWNLNTLGTWDFRIWIIWLSKKGALNF